MNRSLLPHRRASETFNVEFGGMAKSYTVTVGYYDDGRPGEVFIDGSKSGQQMAAICRDGAVTLSMLLQHRVPLETISRALTRDDRNEPMTILCAVVDRLMQEQSAAMEVSNV